MYKATILNPTSIILVAYLGYLAPGDKKYFLRLHQQNLQSLKKWKIGTKTRKKTKNIYCVLLVLFFVVIKFTFII